MRGWRWVQCIMPIINNPCSCSSRGDQGCISCFSCIRTSSSFWFASRVREREDRRILFRQSCAHVQRDMRSSSLKCVAGDMKLRRRSRPKMGASDRKERKTSLRMISGEVRRDDTVCGVGEGVEATVCKMSPICDTDKGQKWFNKRVNCCTNLTGYCSPR